MLTQQTPKSAIMSELISLNSLAAVLLATLVSGLILFVAFRSVGKTHATRHRDVVAASEFRISKGLVIGGNCAIEPFPFGHAKQIDNWAKLRRWLEPRFGYLPETLEHLAQGDVEKHPALDETDAAILTLTGNQSTQRVTLLDPCERDAASLHRAQMQQQGLASCLTVLDQAPYAIRCQSTHIGEIWENRAFQGFSTSETDLILAAAKSHDDNRVQLEDPETGKEKFFRVDKIEKDGIEALYLLDVTEVARAEKVRREFIQTLTKTFANLTTGLAVFDRHRQLALFNPALMDLTNLPAVFLSSQPTMTQFFDRLRDNKVLPEPKNYSTWRNQIDEMIRSASDGLYFEDWSLPNGETYRVAGRPHPDGAVAFLFEDISDEVALTRRFRSQIDIRQAALDTCNQAITIIGPTNVVLLSNKPASSMLGIDPDSSFAEMSIHDFMQACSERLPHDRFWALAESKILSRDASEAIIPDITGRAYRCTINPIRGNSVLVSITEETVRATSDRVASMLSA